MYTELTLKEFQLMSLYTPGYRAGLIDTLAQMQARPASPGQARLAASCLAKLRAMSDADYDDLELYLDCQRDLAGLETDDTPAGSLAF